MKSNHILLVEKLLLALVIALALLPCVGTAKDKAALNEQLLQAIDNGDLSKVRSLLEQGADPNMQTG